MAGMTPTWQSDDGAIQLYHADCRDVLPHLKGIDLLLTDPPYNLARFNCADGGNSHRIRSFGDVEKEWNSAKPTAPELSAIMATCREHVIFGMNNLDLPTTEHFIVWDKEQKMPSFAECELAWSSLRTPAKVGRFRFVSGKCHPAEKPVELFVWILGLSTAATVLDPFMGSGTTGVACVKTGRKFIGIEIDEGYFNIAVKRIKAALNATPLFDKPKVKQGSLI